MPTSAGWCRLRMMVPVGIAILMAIAVQFSLTGGAHAQTGPQRDNTAKSRGPGAPALVRQDQGGNKKSAVKPESMVPLAGHLIQGDIRKQLKELTDRLNELKRQKESIVKQILALEQEISAAQAGCSGAVDAANRTIRQALAAATTAAAAAIGSFFGGPVGAATGASLGASLTGLSLQEIADLVECKNLAQLMKELEELREQLAKIDNAIKNLLNEIEDVRKKEKEMEDRLATRTKVKAMQKPGAIQRTTGSVDGVVQQSGASKLKNDAAKRSAAAGRPCGTSDNPCKEKSTQSTPRSKVLGSGLLDGDRGFGGAGPASAGTAAGGGAGSAGGGGGVGVSTFRSPSGMVAPAPGGGLR